MAEIARSWAVFDVCHTLFAENTTAGFVSFHMRRVNAAKGLCLAGLIRNRWSPFRWLLAACHRVTGWDVSRKLLITLIRGHSYAALTASASDYVDYLLESRKISAVWQHFDDELQRGSRIILASSSLDVVVEELARRLDADSVCSRLAFRDGICLGRLAVDVTGNKQSLVTSRLAGQETAGRVSVYTDNVSDIPLLKMADAGYAVCTLSSSRLRKHALPASVVYVSAE